jgi:lantibiotic modifying enzyme
LVSNVGGANTREAYWTIPPDYEGLGDAPYLGYAHGAAGIADALLDLFEVTGDEGLLRCAKGAYNRLKRLAVPTLADERGLDWPPSEGEGLTGAFWCHGAAGVGRFLLHCAELSIAADAAALAARAARTVARGTRWAGPTQCHGLAGNIEFLLDMYQYAHEKAYLVDALALARLLETFASEQEGMLVWSSDSPTTFTPDYMVGYAGVATCLLRLSDPSNRPHLLSRRGFGHKTSVPV